MCDPKGNLRPEKKSMSGKTGEVQIKPGIQLTVTFSVDKYIMVL